MNSSHIASHSGLRPHLCSTCGQSFTTLSSFKRHCVSVCGPDVNPETRQKLIARKLEWFKKTNQFPCLRCRPVRHYANATKLAQHNFDFHQISSPGITSASLLPKRERVPCDLLFFRPYDRDLHVERTHKDHSDGREKFICQDCGEVYRRRKTLRDHRDTMHPDSGIKNFSCYNCPRTFRRQRDLRKHLTYHAKQE